MNEFINSNKKYLVILAAGVLLLVLSCFWGTEKTAGGADDEQRFKEVMESAEGVGKINVMTNKNDKGEISGVIIVAQGAENLKVKKEIADAAGAVFDVQPHKIQVFSYKQEVDNNESR